MRLLDVVIETPRLVLRPVAADAAAEVFAEFTAEICRHMFPQPARLIDETLAYVSESRARMARGDLIHVRMILPSAARQGLQRARIRTSLNFQRHDQKNGKTTVFWAHPDRCAGSVVANAPSAI